MLYIETSAKTGYNVKEVSDLMNVLHNMYQLMSSNVASYVTNTTYVAS